MTDECCYVCRSCSQITCPNLEPSPGEPRRCADCWQDLERELRDGLAGWGWAS